jgi:lysozyme
MSATGRGTMGRYLDIASYQDVTDAAKVADTDVEGVWAKLTGELGYVNPKREQQINSLRDAGLAVGGYHFGDPRVNPVTQARHFGGEAQRLGLLERDALFPMFDAENAESIGLKWSSAAQVNDYIGTWRSTLRAEFGMLDYLVYGSESWFTSRWIDPRVWGDANAWNWVANYNGRPGVFTLGWSHPQDALHQWRSNAIPFPGISANGLDDNVTVRGHTRESLTIGDSDMQLSDKMRNAWDGDVTVEQVLRAVDYRTVSADENTEEIKATLVAQSAVLAAIAADKDITEARLTEIIGKAVKDNATTGNVDIDELAQKLAEKMPPETSVQDLINALQSVQGTTTFRQRPTGG